MRQALDLFCVRAVFLAAALLVCASCGFDGSGQGAVAVINGRAVTLKQLEAMRDALNMGIESSLPRTAEQLRREYGLALTELLVFELVNQQLEKKKIPVTEDEITAEETLIRGDYPGDSFALMLREEVIDRAVWRGLLKNRLAVQKFRREILRPAVSLTSEEVEAYYHRHSERTIRPAWVYYITVSGADKSRVEKGMKLLVSTADPARVRAEHPDLAVYATRIGKNRLAPESASRLAGIRPGHTAPVHADGRGFRMLLVLDEGAETRLDPSEAYPLLESLLLEQKLDEAFSLWAEKQLSRARVRVARQLLSAMEANRAAAANTAAEPAGSSGQGAPASP